jgi:hypothetical protein
MAVLQSVEELEALLTDRPDRTHTYQIAPSVVPRMIEAVRSASSGAKTREMESAEVEDLARYLEVPVEELHGPFTVFDAACSGCGRRLNILDVAKTGVDDAFHSKSRLVAVLSGSAGHWLTVRGEDGGRFVNCFSCGRKSDMPFNYYDCGVTAYAWA